MMLCPITLLCFSSVVTALAYDDFSAAEYRFPRLFHLDEYDRCLSQQDGLYCLGTFRLSAIQQPNPTYDFMKEYSNSSCHFNRTKLHRGYCVSARCPSSELNVTQRFERCVARWSYKQGFHVELDKLDYCKQRPASTLDDNPNTKIFLAFVYCILLFNVIGTAYDFMSGHGTKNELMMQWSIRSNWQRLTAINDEDYASVQGFRVFLMFMVVMCHVFMIYHIGYLANPGYLEKKIYEKPILARLMFNSPLVQILVTLSSFLYGYNLLKSKKQNRGFLFLLKDIFKRFARLAPVHLLLVGYAATLWPRARDGPLWPSMVTAESDNCRRKFWAHALHIHNFVDADRICLVQTWFLAVNMQLFILAVILMHLLSRVRRHALAILAALFLGSCLLTTGLAYVYSWKSALHFYDLEEQRTRFNNVKSFLEFYTKPWASLPSSILGLFLAHLHFELQQKGVKTSENKWIVFGYHVSYVMWATWAVLAPSIRSATSPALTALYAGLERPLYSLMVSGLLFGMIHGVDGMLNKFFSWRGWQAMGRLSLSALLIHWCVNMAMVASKPLLIYASVFHFMAEVLATECFTYMLAVPVTILVEYPLHRFFNAVVS